MISELTYQLFTIAELREYVLHNANNGITPEMISCPRAYALINNPHALDTDVVLSTVKHGEKTIGYTAVFAEQLAKPINSDRIFWGTTEFVHPSMRGKGVAGKMMKQIKGAVDGKYLGLESSIASVKLDAKQGAKFAYYPKYEYRIKAKTKGCKQWLLEKYVQYKNCRFAKHIQLAGVETRHINYIDDASYEFIKSHSEKDVFLRKQDMLNWMVHYPFLLSKHNAKWEEKEACEFGGVVDEHSWTVMDISYMGERIGIVIYTVRDGLFTLRYVYHEDMHAEKVFAVVAQESLLLDVHTLEFCSLQFRDYLDAHGFAKMNRKHCTKDISFTYYESFQFEASKQMQAGDGDMFC